MAKCAWCGHTIVFGGIERDGELFCRRECELERYPVKFCKACLAETTNESTGNLSRFNGTGFTLVPVRSEEPCEECDSEVARVWFTVMWIPLVPGTYYRVLWRHRPGWFGQGSFLARKLRTDDEGEGEGSQEKPLSLDCTDRGGRATFNR
jgi:hypothetical protein